MAEPSASTMRITAAHLLCVYAEPLASGRRVLVIGDASADLGGRLMDLGARAVHVYDPVAQRVERAPRPRGVTVQPLREAEFEARDGAFDLAIVPDVGALRDPAGVLARLRRIVGPEGAVLVSSKNPEASAFPGDDAHDAHDAHDRRSQHETSGRVGEGRVAEGKGRRPLDYYELYDLVSMQFTTVRMIGQVPFHGFAIAELGESDADPEVTVDTQLVTDAEPPQYYLALASQKDARLEPYAIVQVPRSPAVLRKADGVAALPSAAPVDRSFEPTPDRVVPPAPAPVPASPLSSAAAVAAAKAPLQAALMEAQLRANALSAQLDQERALRTRLVGEAERATAEAHRAAAKAAQSTIDAELVTIDAHRAAARRVEELEDALVARMDACRQLADEVEQQRGGIALLEGALRVAQQTVTALEEQVLQLQSVAIDRTEQAAVLYAELEAVRAAANVPRIDAAKVEKLVAHATRLESRVGELESELAVAVDAVRRFSDEMSRSGDDRGVEVGQVEALLRERAREILTLSREVDRRDRIVQDLLATLDDARSGGGDAATGAGAVDHEAAFAAATSELHADLLTVSRENASMRAKLDAMALDVARREGEMQTLVWKITEQEAQLQAQAPDGRVARLEDELDFVKKALTQEHEARVRAESELARQGALVEKLSGELDAGDRVRIAREEGGAS